MENSVSDQITSQILRDLSRKENWSRETKDSLVYWHFKVSALAKKRRNSYSLSFDSFSGVFGIIYIGGYGNLIGLANSAKISKRLASLEHEVEDKKRKEQEQTKAEFVFNTFGIKLTK